MQKNFTLKRIVCLLAALCLAAGLVGCADMPASSSEESSLPTILVGSDVYPPFNYIGEDGAPTGIDVELAKEAFRRMGYRAEFTIIDWERKTQLLETGDIDCVWGSFTINGREDDYRWAGPYMASRQVVAVMPGSDIETIADLEGRTKEQTGIRNMKVGYNKVFGYYIEVAKSQTDLVPQDWVRKQTTVNAERYISQELKELEHTILSAQDKVVALEYQLFVELREEVCAHVAQIQAAAAAVAQVDVLTSFAVVAAANQYCMPLVDSSSVLSITEGRHPVVEKMLKNAVFVPNDTHMDDGDDLCAIITGPNMAGKSTYMRQVALIVLMAQMGSFVPARSAHIGVVDRVFTRIGASDDLAAGQSTFMVEMSEVAQLLKNASRRSLLILDEIGRGTSTYDGMAIARAVLEHCADRRRLGAKTLFATHYHELTELENTLPGTVNYNIAVKKRGEYITFLRRIVRDVEERGRDLKGIITQYLTTVKPMHYIYVEPTRALADIVINSGKNDVAFDLFVSKIGQLLESAGNKI